MSQRLPFFPDRPLHDFTVTLDDTQYQVVLSYRARRASWYLDLLSEDGTALIRGRRLSPSFSPLPSRLVGGPPGLLTVVGADPYVRDGIFLRYFEAAELGLT